MPSSWAYRGQHIIATKRFWTNWHAGLHRRPSDPAGSISLNEAKRRNNLSYAFDSAGFDGFIDSFSSFITNDSFDEFGNGAGGIPELPPGANRLFDNGVLDIDGFNQGLGWLSDLFGIETWRATASDSDGDGQIDEIIVTGAINNSDGSFSIGSSTFSVDVTGLDAGDLCNANTAFGFATSAYALYSALLLAAGSVGFGAYFALGMAGLFFASANHATCSV